MSKKSYAYAQLEGVALEMRMNKDMVFFYEYETPVATLPTGEVLDLTKEFGTLRTSGHGWAIDESWLVGSAVGVAAAGSIAVVRLPSMTTLYAIEYIYNQAGKLRSMTGGQASMPFVLWQGGGSRTRGSAGQHTEVGQEALYANLPGVKVVVPSNAYDAKGLLIAAIRDPDPVIYFDYPEVKSGEQPDVPDDAYEVPIAKAVVRQQGKDVTLVAWAPATVEVKQPGVVREVEELGPELHVETLIVPEPVVLEQTEVQVVRAVPADIGQGAGSGAVSERRRLAEH
jgi:acetoin:2,6-dichlorophenolindophenol oxidoreductase subunit beta